MTRPGTRPGKEIEGLHCIDRGIISPWAGFASISMRAVRRRRGACWSSLWFVVMSLLVRLGATKGDAATLFVMVSMPRSGTEWLRSMLNDHPEICCDGEPLLRLGRLTAGASGAAQGAALGRVLDAVAENRRDADGVLKPCKKRRALARGFKWFDGQGGVATAPGNPLLGNFTTWVSTHRARFIVLERQGLAKLVSDRLKHLSSRLGVRAVPTHCRDEKCSEKVSSQRVVLSGDVASDLDAAVDEFSSFLGWARRTVPYDDLLYMRYRDLVDDPDREMQRVYAFLGVDRDHATNASLLLKSVTTPLSAMIENYEDVKPQLRKGGWGREIAD